MLLSAAFGVMSYGAYFLIYTLDEVGFCVFHLMTMITDNDDGDDDDYWQLIVWWLSWLPLHSFC